MKIGVIADTHIPYSADRIPPACLDALRECSLIIHAGDIVSKEVITDLQGIAETKAVRGNMDDPDLKRCLPEKLMLEVEGATIGVIHGSGPAFRVLQNVKKEFHESPDIIIFGHSHSAYNEKIEGTVYFNPGSPTDTVYSPYRSFGLIDIEDGSVSARIIRIDG